MTDETKQAPYDFIAPSAKRQQDQHIASENAKLLCDSTTLPFDACRVGATVARKLFAARGNNSEVHLSEYELTAVIATGIQTDRMAGRS